MLTLRKATAIGVAVGGLSLAGIALSAERPPPLPIEPTGIIETLPKAYPEHWFLVHDVAFFHMSDGKIYVIDADADTQPEQVKGTFNLSLIGNITQSARRHEMYSMETFHSRGSRGDRLDALTIWNPATLSPLAEVLWPKPIRYVGMPQRYAMLLIDNDRFLAVANTTLRVGDSPSILIYLMLDSGSSSLAIRGRIETP